MSRTPKAGAKAPALPPSPPVLPQFPIPPGEHPPALTREEQEAWAKYWADDEKYTASLFDLERLNKIVTEAGAPALQDTASTRVLIDRVARGISNRCIPKNLDIEKLKRQEKERRKAWTSLRKYVARREEGEGRQRQFFVDRPWYGQEPVRFRDGLIEKFRTFTAAMEAIEPWLFSHRSKTRGEHGTVTISNPLGAVDFFTMLSWAWDEASIAHRVSAEKRYKIVQSYLAFTGESASLEAIKKIIAQEIKANPWRTNKAAYHERFLAMAEETRLTESGE